MFICVRTEFLIILQVDAEDVRAEQDKTFTRMLLTKAKCGMWDQYKSQFKRVNKSPVFFSLCHYSEWSNITIQN